jgi:hypothetical protein
MGQSLRKKWYKRRSNKLTPHVYAVTRSFVPLRGVRTIKQVAVDVVLEDEFRGIEPARSKAKQNSVRVSIFRGWPPQTRPSIHRGFLCAQTPKDGAGLAILTYQ